jgi:CDP-diacylglycerol--glycerol-3-phosphate 3-phosphatidyltransferase
VTDQDLIDRFESGAVPESAFHHADHVRLAFAYLRSYPALSALKKFSCALKQFATSHGKPQRYNETVTHAYFFLIRERMARCGPKGVEWEEFALRNPDLLTWKDGILHRYYEDATLNSDLARSVFVFPDKCR